MHYRYWHNFKPSLHSSLFPLLISLPSVSASHSSFHRQTVHITILAIPTFASATPHSLLPTLVPPNTTLFVAIQYLIFPTTKMLFTTALIALAASVSVVSAQSCAGFKDTVDYHFEIAPKNITTSAGKRDEVLKVRTNLLHPNTATSKPMLTHHL